MEQYLLHLPNSVADLVRKRIQNHNVDGIKIVSGADNKNFILHIDNETYPVTLVSTPCIIETHKTYDDQIFYKCGEIGQIFICHDKNEKNEEIKENIEIATLSGITPPTTNIVKRKFEKTKKQIPYPKEDVARVEEDLNRIMSANGGTIEIIEEELVEYKDWMISDEYPRGVVITDEVELLRKEKFT